MNVAVFYFCVNKSYLNPGFHDMVDKTLEKTKTKTKNS